MWFDTAHSINSQITSFDTSVDSLDSDSFLSKFLARGRLSLYSLVVFMMPIILTADMMRGIIFFGYLKFEVIYLFMFSFFNCKINKHKNCSF